MVDAAKIALTLYGILLIIGGVIGFQQAASLASLVGGIVAGVLAIIASVLVAREPIQGLTMGLFVALFVGAFFLFRLIKTSAFMPAGMTLVLSILTIIVVSIAFSSLRSGQ